MLWFADISRTGHCAVKRTPRGLFTISTSQGSFKGVLSGRMNAGLTHKSIIPGGAFHSRKEPDLKELVRPDLQQAFEKFKVGFPKYKYGNFLDFGFTGEIPWFVSHDTCTCLERRRYLMGPTILELLYTP
jgi:hypothetical protein